MASSSSYCTRWHAILYSTMAVILAAIAISMTLRTDPTAQTPKSTAPISHVISLSASGTLQASGFTVTATLNQI
ncbi:hypothetical protein RchiOBHm_Chr4g0411291 [Rosa chinensis]|uniref:Uncharacterized protein n=1 Tax=Rosa chinensis TaxID=74649 RepID=A0A2P6QVL8_ROSCH|nr:hypothetical protein RchiOBHm_Chr4g0411291 [Rosa chinensis]